MKLDRNDFGFEISRTEDWVPTVKDQSIWGISLTVTSGLTEKKYTTIMQWFHSKHERDEYHYGLLDGDIELDWEFYARELLKKAGIE